MKPKIKIHNKTNYDSANLKKIIYETAKRFRGARKATPNLSVYVEYRKRKNDLWASGQASYSGSWMTLRLPREFKPDTAKDQKRAVVQVIAHELLHSHGTRHSGSSKSFMRQLMKSQYSIEFLKSTEFDFADSLEFKLKTEVTKPKINLQQQRYDHARRMLEKKVTQLKRLMAAKHKWESKVRYYERSLSLADKKK